MLQQFSWEQFLIALGALALLWYAVVVLVFYRRELRSFISGGWRTAGDGSHLFNSGATAALPHRWQKGVQDLSGQETSAPEGLNPEDGLMGKSRLPEGMSSLSMEELSFFSGEQDGLSRDAEDQQGLVPDVLEDIKAVFGMLAKEDGTKRDFFRLMETVRLSYPGLSAHPALRRINGFITDHASFHLSAQELEDLWN